MPRHTFRKSGRAFGSPRSAFPGIRPEDHPPKFAHAEAWDPRSLAHAERGTQLHYFAGTAVRPWFRNTT